MPSSRRCMPGGCRRRSPLRFEHRVVNGAPIHSVRLKGGGRELGLNLAASGTCVEAAARLGDRADAARTVMLGDQRLATAIGEEIRVRARDFAFERALTKALERAR